MTQSTYKSPFDFGNLIVEEKVNNETLLKEKSKSFENMSLCKTENGSFCRAVDYTAFLTGGEAGSIGSGNHEAPAKKCSLCESNCHDSSKVRRTSNGWY